MRLCSIKHSSALKGMELSAYALGVAAVTAVALGAMGLFGSSCQQWMHFTLPKAIPVTYWPLLGATPFLVGIVFKQIQACQPQQRDVEIRPKDVNERYNALKDQFEVYDAQTGQWQPSDGIYLTDKVRQYLDETGGELYAGFKQQLT